MTTLKSYYTAAIAYNIGHRNDSPSREQIDDENSLFLMLLFDATAATSSVKHFETKFSKPQNEKKLTHELTTSTTRRALKTISAYLTVPLTRTHLLSLYLFLITSLSHTLFLSLYRITSLSHCFTLSHLSSLSLSLSFPLSLTLSLSLFHSLPLSLITSFTHSIISRPFSLSNSFFLSYPHFITLSFFHQHSSLFHT